MNNNTAILQKEYLTTTEFATLCGVSRFTIINWIKKGKIRAIRTLGRQYRIPLEETASLLETSPPGKSHEEQKSGPAKESATEKKSFLYGFGYGIGRGVNGIGRGVNGMKRFSGKPSWINKGKKESCDDIQ